MNELPLVIDYADKVVGLDLSLHVEMARQIFNSKKIHNQLVLFYNKANTDYETYLDQFYELARRLLGQTYLIKAEISESDRLFHHFGFFEYRQTAFVIFVELYV
jgi:hypothetical protein